MAPTSTVFLRGADNLVHGTVRSEALLAMRPKHDRHAVGLHHAVLDLEVDTAHRAANPRQRRKRA